MDFCGKKKSVNISKTVRDRAISSKFLTCRVVQESPVQRGKISIFATFGGHLTFLRKMKKCQYLENRNRSSNFERFFDPQGDTRVFCPKEKKFIFATFGGHLGFLPKMEKCQYLEKHNRYSGFKRIFDLQDGTTVSYAKGKNFNVVFLPLRYSAGDTYRGSGLVKICYLATFFIATTW